LKHNNITKDCLLKICKAVGCDNITIENSKTEMVSALNDKYGYEKFRQSKTNGGQTYEIRDSHSSFIEHCKIRNSMKKDDDRALECPCCHQEFNHKKFKNLNGTYSKYCKYCRELKHGQ